MRSRFFFSTIGGDFDPDYQAVLNYGTSQGYDLPSAGQKILQNQLVINLKDIGVWSLLDLLYLFATDGDRDFARINWKDPGNFTLIEGNAPTFTTNIGFVGNGVNMYLNTGWAPNPDGVNWTLDEAGFFTYINNNITPGATSEWALGCQGDASFASQGALALLPERTTGDHTYAINGGTSIRGSSVSSQGFFHVRRTADNDTRIFKNASQVGTTATGASNSLSTRDLHLLAGFNATQTEVVAAFSNFQMGVFGIGASLSGSESDLYTVWNDYFTNI